MSDFDELQWQVVNGDATTVVELTQALLGRGKSPEEVLDLALIPAMDMVGERFQKQEFYLPEMLVAARAMQAGLAILKPRLLAGQTRARGRVVIGTVRRDLHDIGKNLVGMMLQGAGLEVVDLGADVKAERFVDAVREEKPDLVMMSALLTSTMSEMKETIDALKDAGLRGSVRIAVGGAPVTQRFAEEIGADFYGQDAAQAATWAKQVVAR